MKSDFEDAWIMDTNTAQQLTYNKDLFWTYQYCNLNSIFLADDTNHIP